MSKTPGGKKKVHKSSETLFREILCNYMIETVGNYNCYLEVEDFPSQRASGGVQRT